VADKYQHPREKLYLTVYQDQMATVYWRGALKSFWHWNRSCQKQHFNSLS